MRSVDNKIIELKAENARIDALLKKADRLLWLATVLIGVVIFNGAGWALVTWLGGL